MRRITKKISLERNIKIKSDTGLSHLKGDPIKRVVGLWLYDKVQDLENKHGDVKRAIEEFRKTGYDEKLFNKSGYEYLDDPELRKYYNITKDSIATGMVLPFYSK